MRPMCLIHSCYRHTRIALIGGLVYIVIINGLSRLDAAALAVQDQVIASSEVELWQMLKQAPEASPIVLENMIHRMEFGPTGTISQVIDKRTKLSIDVEQLRGKQFMLTSRVGEGVWKESALDEMVQLNSGRFLVVGDFEQQIAFIFETDWTDHYLRFDLVRIVAPQSMTLGRLDFEFCIDGPAKVYPLDYMTQVRVHGPRLQVEIPWLWGVQEGEHMGSFALTLPDDDAAEDEALLHLWVDGWLPQPKVQGEWTLERARAWLADWQARYVDQSTMIVQPKNPEELDALCEQAVLMGMQRIYLHTDVWRGEYWPRKLSFMHVNREVFPEGEADLKRLADSLKEDGIGLAVHTVSCVIGGEDPDYVKGGLDPRLASWVEAELVESIDANARNIRIRPKHESRIPILHTKGEVYGPEHHYPFIDITCFQIGDEILQAGQISELEPGIWELADCRRAIYETSAVAHEFGAHAKGLYRPYRQAFTADVQSSLLHEVAERFGEFFNRVGLSHMECDGLENHLSLPWGRSKFTWLLYQQIDHPTTSNTSSGSPLPWHIEYWFKSSAQVRANHPTGGVAGGDGMPLYVHDAGRLATGPYEINVRPTDAIGRGSQSVHFMRPQPMFGISVEALKTHGLSGMFMESIRLWKQALASLSEEQRAELKVPYVRPPKLSSVRNAMETLYRPVEAGAGVALQPYQAVQPTGNKIPWAWRQEGGPSVPRAYFQVGGAPISMEIPNDSHALEFTVRVLPSFRSEDLRERRMDAVQEIDTVESQVAKDYLETVHGKASEAAGSVTVGETDIVNAKRSLMPEQINDIRAQGAHRFAFWKGMLAMTFSGDAKAEVWNENRPNWGCRNLVMHPNQGLRLVVVGDGSGARLVVTLHGHGRGDFVVPIDFTGRREFLIPTSLAALSRADWGWRWEARHFKPGSLHQVELGFGYVPKGVSPRVNIEALELIPAYRTEVNKLSLMLGGAALQVGGPVYTDEYLWYRGGDTVQVYDLNWNLSRSLPVKVRGLQLNSGTYPMQFWAEDTQPHLELQMISLGGPIPL